MKILHVIPSLRQPGLVNIHTSERGRGGMKLYSTLTGAGENDTKLYLRKEVLKMKKKLTKNGGFTLVEMLIVVAIIAILVAVSIPLINSALEKARDAADQANERAAKAEAAILILDQDGEYATITGGATYADLKNGAYYDADKGKLMKENKDIDPYGRHTANCTSDYAKKDGTVSGGALTAAKTHVDCVIKITYSEDSGEYTIVWES